MKAKIAITGISCLRGSMQGKIDPDIFNQDINQIEAGHRELYRVQKIACITALRALKDADININNSRVGVLFGNSYGIEEFKTGFYKTYKQSPPQLTSPSLFAYTTSNSISSNISIMLGLQCINLTFASGLISGSQAVIAGVDLLNDDKIDTAIVIGECFICDDFKEEFNARGVLNEYCSAIILEKNVSNKKVYGFIDNLKQGFMLENNNIKFDNRLAASGILGIISACNILKQKNKQKVSFVNIDSLGGYAAFDIV